MNEFTGQLVDTGHDYFEDYKHTLIELAETFKIPIDEERIEDYTLSNVNCKMPSIKIVDRTRGITYTSIMTDYSSILGFTADSKLKKQVNQLSGRKEEAKVFVRVTTTDSEFTELTEEYALCFEVPFASRLDSYFESDKLSITKLDRCNLELPTEETSSAEIIYTKDFFGKKEKSTLSQKMSSCNQIYKRAHEKESMSYQDEELGTVMKSRFSHEIDGNVYYGINETLQGKTLFSCVCLETAQKHGELWPSSLKAEQYLELEMLDTLSAFIFKGIDNGIKHSLTIYKKSDRFDVSYAVGVRDKIGVHVKKTQVPIIQRGKVTIEEIDSLIEALCTILEDEFGVKVIVELKEFQRRMTPIQINDKISLRRIYMMSSKNIFNEISENREQFFETLDREYQDFKSIGGILSRQGKPFTITPKKNKK